MSRVARPLAPVIAVLAAAFFLPNPNSPASAADACLSAPNAPAPRGSHWYYRTERPSLRKCWRLVQKDAGDQPAAAATTQAEPDVMEPVPAASPPAERVTETDAQPVIRTLVTRNVSNTHESAPPPPSEPSQAPSTPSASAAAPMQAAAPGDAPVHTADQAAAAPAAEPSQPVDATAAVPGLGLLLLAIALLVVLAGAAFGVMRIALRRADVLDTVRETDEAPFDASPALVPAAEAPALPRLAPRVRFDPDEAPPPRRRRAWA
jgi:hypothetical protein